MIALLLATAAGMPAARAECDVVASIVVHNLAQANPGSYRVSATLEETTPICSDGSTAPTTRKAEIAIVLLSGGFSCGRSAEPVFDPALGSAVVIARDSHCGLSVMWTAGTSVPVPEAPETQADPPSVEAGVRRPMRAVGHFIPGAGTFPMATEGPGTFLLRTVTIST